MSDRCRRGTAAGRARTGLGSGCTRRPRDHQQRPAALHRRVQARRQRSELITALEQTPGLWASRNTPRQPYPGPETADNAFPSATADRSSHLSHRRPSAHARNHGHIRIALTPPRAPRGAIAPTFRFGGPPPPSIRPAQLAPCTALRLELTVGPTLLCDQGPTRGRPWSGAAARGPAPDGSGGGVRRRFRTASAPPGSRSRDGASTRARNRGPEDTQLGVTPKESRPHPPRGRAISVPILIRPPSIDARDTRAARVSAPLTEKGGPAPTRPPTLTRAFPTVLRPSSPPPASGARPEVRRVM